MSVLAVPYHLGHLGVGMGAGPAAIAPAAERLVLDEHPGHEVGACFALNRLLARRVREGDVVLSGNCHVAQGMVTALGPEDLGILWLDAHGDFQTPDTTPSGFFDGCALALVCGRGWRALSEGFAPVAADRIVHVGGRDFDPGERERMEGAGVRFGSEGIAEVGAERWYVHLDLDVLDPDAVGRANGYAAPGGLTVTEVTDVLARLPGRVVAAAVTAYDPACDPEGAVCAAGRELLSALMPAGAGPPGARR